jgi:hypothetical protein
MNFDLTDEQKNIQRLARDFAQQEVKPVAEELDRTKSFPYEIVGKLGELGLMGIPFPRSTAAAARTPLLRARDRGARPRRLVGRDHVAAHTSLGTWPIYAFGTDDQKQQCSRPLRGQEALELRPDRARGGSDAGNVRTTAKLEDGEWVVNGAKQFITNAGTDISGGVTITARTGDNEVSNIIVPKGTPGYEIGEAYRKMGWNASDTRPLSFDGARVPEENLLGPRGMGFKQFLQTLDGGPDRSRPRCRWAWRRARSTRRSPTPRSARVRPADLQVPGDPGQARRHVDRDRGGAPAHLQGRVPEGPGQHFTLTAAQAKLKTGRLAVRGLRGGRADPRRLRLHRGVPGLPLLPRREDPHDRRGHRRGAADGDRTGARSLSQTRPHAPEPGALRRLPSGSCSAAAYASTLGMDSVPGHDYAGDEAHYLLAARSVVKQHALDVRDDYRERGWRRLRSRAAQAAGSSAQGARATSRTRSGCRCCAAPFYALGGAKAVELMVAALLAAAMALSYLLARRVVPDPWCGYATLAIGLSPPLVATGTAVRARARGRGRRSPALRSCAARLRDGPSRFAAIGGFVLLGLRCRGSGSCSSRRRRARHLCNPVAAATGRGFLALASSEVAFFSLALLVGLNEALFGGPTPHAADAPGTSATGADSVSDYLGARGGWSRSSSTSTTGWCAGRRPRR